MKSKNANTNGSRVTKELCYTMIFFGIIYALISLVNHFNFRTYALDLGLYNNALYDYRHFHWSDTGVMQAINENLLADHFDIYLILFSPLSYIFGSYTLLIVQIAAVLLGGVGVYKFISIDNNGSMMPLFAAIHFYLFFGIFSALSFDYHSNVVAAMIVPWFFYFFRLRKYAISSLLFLLICIAKENMALWLFFICIGLLISYRKDKKARLTLSIYACFSILYFVTIVQAVMPVFSEKNVYPHFEYSVLGKNIFQAMSTIVSHPLETAKALFVNHTANPSGDYYKAELYLFVLFSGGLFLFAKPEFLIMLIPVVFQKMLHDNNTMWSISGQYSIEFAPVVTIGVFTFLSGLKNIKLANILAFLVLILTLAVTIRRMDRTMVFTDTARIRFYKQSHYLKSYDVAKVHAFLNGLSADVVISAQSPFLPHVAMRDKVYQFPIIRDAGYIVYSTRESTYPLSEEDFENELKSIHNSDQWEIMVDYEDFKILKRKN